jgi:hypothetical protein
VPRPLTGPMSSALGGSLVKPVFLVEAEFTSGFLRIWSGLGPVSWNGHTWSGSRANTDPETVLVGMTSIQESIEIAANGIKLRASGIKSSMITRVLDECRQNYPVTVYLGALDPGTDALIADPAQAFSGRMDVPVLSDTGETCEVEISVENELIDLQRPRERRYTHEDQQIDHPGDMGFEYVSQLQELNLAWGKATATIPSAGGGGPVGPIPRPTRLGA